MGPCAHDKLGVRRTCSADAYGPVQVVLGSLAFRVWWIAMLKIVSSQRSLVRIQHSHRIYALSASSVITLDTEGAPRPRSSTAAGRLPCGNNELVARDRRSRSKAQGRRRCHGLARPRSLGYL
jgi:hypothetical protein